MGNKSNVLKYLIYHFECGMTILISELKSFKCFSNEVHFVKLKKKTHKTPAILLSLSLNKRHKPAPNSCRRQAQLTT